MDRLFQQFRIARARGDRAAELILVSKIARRLGLSIGQVYKLTTA